MMCLSNLVWLWLEDLVGGYELRVRKQETNLILRASVLGLLCLKPFLLVKNEIYMSLKLDEQSIYDAGIILNFIKKVENDYDYIVLVTQSNFRRAFAKQCSKTSASCYFESFCQGMIDEIGNISDFARQSLINKCMHNAWRFQDILVNERVNFSCDYMKKSQQFSSTIPEKNTCPGKP